MSEINTILNAAIGDGCYFNFFKETYCQNYPILNMIDHVLSVIILSFSTERLPSPRPTSSGLPVGSHSSDSTSHCCILRCLSSQLLILTLYIVKSILKETSLSRSPYGVSPLKWKRFIIFFNCSQTAEPHMEDCTKEEFHAYFSDLIHHDHS